MVPVLLWVEPAAGAGEVVCGGEAEVDPGRPVRLLVHDPIRVVLARVRASSAFGGGVPLWGAVVLAHERVAPVEVALLGAVVNAPQTLHRRELLPFWFDRLIGAVESLLSGSGRLVDDCEGIVRIRRLAHLEVKASVIGGKAAA